MGNTQPGIVINMGGFAEKVKLLRACDLGNVKEAERLINMGVDIEFRDDIGRTPLIFSVRRGHESIVRLFIDNGANINAKDYYGLTALTFACENNHEPIARLLLEKGANIEEEDNKGSNLLRFACRKDHESIARLLIENGAHFEAKSKFEIPSLDRLSFSEIKRLVLGESSFPLLLLQHLSPSFSFFDHNC